MSEPVVAEIVRAFSPASVSNVRVLVTGAIAIQLRIADWLAQKSSPLISQADSPAGRSGIKHLLRKPLQTRVAGRTLGLQIEAAVGMAAAVVALWVTLLLQPLLQGAIPFAFGFVAVTMATVLAGWRSGLIALVLAQVLLSWAVLGAPISFTVGKREVAALVAATAAQLILIATIALYQREVRHAWSARDEVDRTRELLAAELAHRVKNTLAVVQSVARQSFASGSRLDALAQFESRLANIAGSHDLLTDNNWEPASISSVIERCLAPFRGKPDQFELAGPPVLISPKRAVNLALGLHELATNAVKYGALSATGGRVTIEWSLGDDNSLTLTWTEAGGPPVSPPSRRGFGSRMIERGIAAEMGGCVDLEFDPAGVRCTIRGQAE